MRKIKENGNVMFLILIFVALFAALSFAVTQSNRGGGDISEEEVVISAARITQAAAATQVAVTRMITMGTAIEDIDLRNGASPCTTGVNCVFAPEGGGVVLPELPQNVDKNASNPAYFQLYEAADLASKSGVYDGQEGILLLMVKDLNEKVCERLNTGLGLSNPPTDEPEVNVNTGDIAAYPGEWAGCVDDANVTEEHDYFHVLATP